MSFTYDLKTDIGKLRLELQDVNADDYNFEDEELQYFLDKAKAHILWAKVFVCEARAMMDASMNGLEIEVGDTRVKGGVTAGSGWQAIANELREKLQSGLSYEGATEMYAFTSGIFTNDRQQNEKDIETGLIIERDFYDCYNESGIRGGIVADGEDYTHRAD